MENVDYASLPLKTDAHLTREEFLKLTRTSRSGSPQVVDAFEELRSSFSTTGIATYRGHEFEAGEHRRTKGRSFYVARAEAERLAGLLGLRVGGYPEKGRMLILREVAGLLKVTDQNPAFASAWDAVETAARAGRDQVDLGGKLLRASMILSGTRSAAALHPDDVDAFAEASGLTHHLRRSWEPGWLNMNEVADRLGTHTSNDAFAGAWRALSEALETRGAPSTQGARIQACVMKKRNVVVLFLHEDSLGSFVQISDLERELRPVPRKTPEWRGTVEFAREGGFGPANPAYRNLLAQLVGDVDADRVPTIDGRPVLFERRAARSLRPFCFHVDERERIASHLGVRPATERTDEDLERRDVFASLGLSSGGNIAAKWLWDRCVERWADGIPAVVDGRELSGGWRKTHTRRHWCLDAASLDGFLDVVASREAAMLGDGLTRDAVAVALRASPFKDPEFMDLWNEVRSLAAEDGPDGTRQLLRGTPVRAWMARTSTASRQVVFLDEHDLPAFAGLLGRPLPFLVGDPAEYVGRREVAKELGLRKDDGHLAFLWNELRFRHATGTANVGGHEIACGFMQMPKTPFVVARLALSTLADLHADLVAGEDISVDEEDAIYAEEGVFDALLDDVGPSTPGA